LMNSGTVIQTDSILVIDKNLNDIAAAYMNINQKDFCSVNRLINNVFYSIFFYHNTKIKK